MNKLLGLMVAVVLFAGCGGGTTNPGGDGGSSDGGGGDGGTDSGMEFDAGRQPQTDGGSPVDFVAVADETTFAFAWNARQTSSFVAKWELNALLTDGGRLPEVYVTPASARSHLLVAPGMPTADGGSVGTGESFRYFVSGVDNVNLVVPGEAPDAGVEQTDAGTMCKLPTDCAPEKGVRSRPVQDPDVSGRRHEHLPHGLPVPVGHGLPPLVQRCRHGGRWRGGGRGRVRSPAADLRCGDAGDRRAVVRSDDSGGWLRRAPSGSDRGRLCPPADLRRAGRPAVRSLHLDPRQGLPGGQRHRGADRHQRHPRSHDLQRREQHRVRLLQRRPRRSGAAQPRSRQELGHGGGDAGAGRRRRFSSTIKDCAIAPWKSGGAVMVTVEDDQLMVRTVTEALSVSAPDVAFVASNPLDTDGGITLPSFPAIATSPVDSTIHIGFTGTRPVGGTTDTEIYGVFRDGTQPFSAPLVINNTGLLGGTPQKESFVSLVVEKGTKRALAAYTSREEFMGEASSTVYVSLFNPATKKWGTGSDLTVMAKQQTNFLLFPARGATEQWDAFSPSLAITPANKIFLSLVAGKKVPGGFDFRMYLVGFSFEQQSPLATAKGWYLAPAQKMSETRVLDPRAASSQVPPSVSALTADQQISVYSTFIEGVGANGEQENRAIFVSRP